MLKIYILRAVFLYLGWEKLTNLGSSLHLDISLEWFSGVLHKIMGSSKRHPEGASRIGLQCSYVIRSSNLD